MMRMVAITYNEDRDCTGCSYRQEKQISTYILAFEIAENLIKRYGGQWKIAMNDIILSSNALSYPLIISFNSGTIRYGILMSRYYHRYDSRKGVATLVRELCSDLTLPDAEEKYEVDFLFKVFVKLVEIFHGSCDLHIVRSNVEGDWEIRLNEDGPYGWISADYIAENRFGEKIDITQWKNMRTEKAATNIFGFNRFCTNFECPVK